MTKAPSEAVAGNGRPRTHKGDFLTRGDRSQVMSKIKSRDTGPELILKKLLLEAGFSFEQQARDLPGSPDFVFRNEKIAIFIEGDFWHGWQFSKWRHKLSWVWEEKIQKNIARDEKNAKILRTLDWNVIRIWEHQIQNNPSKCLNRIIKMLKA